MNSLVKLLQKEAFTTNKFDKATSDRENQKINSMMQNLRKGISKETLEKIKKAKEPTWIAITPWSECSKPCGGGKSYLQRICIVPKFSKEHCDGNRIINKECNVHSCNENEEKLNSSLIKNKKIKNTNSISSNNFIESSAAKKQNIKLNSKGKKLIRYERCFIKEGDLALFINEGYLKGTKIPVRVILNNSTLNVYSSDVIKN